MEELIEKIFKKGRKVKSKILYREPELYLILFFSLGFLSDSYVQAAEELLKQKKPMEASYYSRKAAMIRSFCYNVFKKNPEKDYYTGSYKMPEEIVAPASPEDLQQTAEFCASNLEINEEVIGDVKKLGKKILEEIKKQKKTGIAGKYIEEIRKRFKEAKENPDRLADLYEVLLVLKNVQRVLSALGEVKQRKELLKGFKVKT